MTLPKWNVAGVVPPVRPGSDPTGLDRSPYRVTLDELVNTFATSADRSLILQGLLNYRMALYALGISNGIQWIDGSFVEDTETLESRPPNDIDVVSYVSLPTGQTQQTLFPQLKPLQDRNHTKATYKVDAFVFVAPQINMRNICYWYSLYSHRRDGLWKGFAEVELNPSDDNAAQASLTQVVTAGFP